MPPSYQQDLKYLNMHYDNCPKHMVTVWKNTSADFTHLHLPLFREIIAVTSQVQTLLISTYHYSGK